MYEVWKRHLADSVASSSGPCITTTLPLLTLMCATRMLKQSMTTVG